jgi:hypothetical protein
MQYSCGNRHSLSDGPTHRFHSNDARSHRNGVAIQRHEETSTLHTGAFYTVRQHTSSEMCADNTRLDKTATQLHYIHADIHIRISTHTHAYTYTQTHTATRATPQDRHHTVIAQAAVRLYVLHNDNK